jgi:hypothetical protein
MSFLAMNVIIGFALCLRQHFHKIYFIGSITKKANYFNPKYFQNEKNKLRINF